MKKQLKTGYLAARSRRRGWHDEIV